MLTKTLLAIAVFAVATPSIWAHHSFAAEFDPTKPVKLKGTVTQMEWINPHSWIHMDVKNADGTVTSWMIEGGSPNALLRRGFTKNSLPVGKRDHGGGLSGQGFIESRQRPRSHFRRRAKAFPGFGSQRRPGRQS
jgi:hypothetical protein